MESLWTVSVLTFREQLSSILTRRLVNVLAIAIVLWLIALSTGVFGFAGLGGYSDEKALGDGTNENIFLGAGENGPIVLDFGTSPTTTTEPGFALMWNVLLVIIALVIFVTILRLSGNPMAAMVAAVIGVIAFIIVRQMLLTI